MTHYDEGSKINTGSTGSNCSGVNKSVSRDGLIYMLHHTNTFDAKSKVEIAITILAGK